jgi:hypothetical protein
MSTTFEFTATTPALQQARAFLQSRRKYFCFPNALGYLRSCKFLLRWMAL